MQLPARIPSLISIACAGPAMAADPGAVRQPDGAPANAIGLEHGF